MQYPSSLTEIPERITRTDSAHPTKSKIHRAQLTVNQIKYPRYCSRVLLNYASLACKRISHARVGLSASSLFRQDNTVQMNMAQPD